MENKSKNIKNSASVLDGQPCTRLIGFCQGSLAFIKDKICIWKGQEFLIPNGDSFVRGNI